MLKELWILMLVAGILCLCLSLFLFFIWKIPELLDELSGRKAKRQIQRLKEINSNTGTLSTEEMFTGISMFNGELSAEVEDSFYSVISSEAVEYSSGSINEFKESEEEVEDIDEVATSDLSEESTMYFSAEEDLETSFMDEEVIVKGLNIRVIEEFSSL